MIGTTWPPRGQNRGQRKQPSDMISNGNADPADAGNHASSINPSIESKSEQSLNGDDGTASPMNEPIEDEAFNVEEKQERPNNRPERQRSTRNNQQSNSMPIENRGRRYYEGNTNANSSNNNNNSNNHHRRPNDRDRSSWQDRSGGNNSNNNNNNNPRFRSDMNSGSNHGPPLCKFFLDNRCMKVSPMPSLAIAEHRWRSRVSSRATNAPSVTTSSHRRRWTSASTTCKTRATARRTMHALIYTVTFHVNSFTRVRRIASKAIDVNSPMMPSTTTTSVLPSNE